MNIISDVNHLIKKKEVEYLLHIFLIIICFFLSLDSEVGKLQTIGKTVSCFPPPISQSRFRLLLGPNLLLHGIEGG